MSKNYGFIMTAVTELVVTILLFIFAGRWADGRFHLSGSLGVASGAVFTRLIMRLQSLKDD